MYASRTHTKTTGSLAFLGIVLGFMTLTKRPASGEPGVSIAAGNTSRRENRRTIFRLVRRKCCFRVDWSDARNGQIRQVSLDAGSSISTRVLNARERRWSMRNVETQRFYAVSAMSQLDEVTISPRKVRRTVARRSASLGNTIARRYHWRFLDIGHTAV
jgi:hypothetical protein